MRRYHLVLLVIILVLVVASMSFAEGECEEDDTDAAFPELTKFHDIMATIWHKHLPNDNFAAMRKTAPDLAAAFETLKAADLPKSLKGKEAAVKAQIEKLGGQVAAFSEVAKGKQDKALGTAIEQVHDAYHHLMQVMYTKEDKHDHKEKHDHKK